MKNAQQRGNPKGSLFSLSRRGHALADIHPFPTYLQEHFARVGSRYNAQSNPTGYIDLCIAENKLVWQLLKPQFQARREVPHRALCYDSMSGSIDFKKNLGRFMGEHFCGRIFEPEQIAVLSGAGSVLELLFYALGDPDDGVLVPTPSYAGFWADLETRDALRIIPVHGSSENGFQVTCEQLEHALAEANRPVKALLFTSPSNPLGRVYTPDEISQVIAWAQKRGLHLVFDEIYALSVFGERQFTSCAKVQASLGDNIHIVWAFSKDFGVSGLRCGVLVSENQELLRAVDALSYWACCSGDTQWILGQIISDESWVQDYIGQSQQLLFQSYQCVTDALNKHTIPFLQSAAGFFLLCDLRPFMKVVTWEAETALWQTLLDRANVNLTPGVACRIGEPGFMRLCFAAQPLDAAVEAVERIGQVLCG